MGFDALLMLVTSSRIMISAWEKAAWRNLVLCNGALGEWGHSIAGYEFHGIYIYLSVHCLMMDV